MKRILVVNVNWLGDCILTLPTFKALKEKFPSSYVGAMVVKRLKSIFENNPYIDEVIEFDEKTIHRSLISKIKFVNLLKKKNFDTAILIHRSFTRAFICTLAGIERRIGFKRLKNYFVLTLKVNYPQKDIHRADYYFSLFEKMGIPIRDRIPNFFIKDEEKQKAEDLLKDYKKNFSYLVALNPSSNWPLKRWPHKNFAHLINNLGEINCGIFLIGAEKDKDVVKKILERVNTDVVNLCGKTSLQELAAILERMDILISGDSGPAHMAASLGIKVLVLFGPTSPLITGPRGENVYIFRKEIDCKIPCYKLDCKDNLCMKRITPHEVLCKVRDILKNG